MAITLNGSSGILGAINSGTAQNSTSGTSINFTDIPAGVKRITVMFSGVSTSGTSIPQIQLGVSGAPETSSYVSIVGFVSTTNNTTRGGSATSGFILNYGGSSSEVYSGAITLCLLGSNTWTCSGTLSDIPSAGILYIAGSKALAGVLNLVRITTVNGTDTFDAGSINILYE